jgi:hypothetical protein
MKRLMLLALLAVGPSALAQVRVEIALPTIAFPAPPPLVVVQPGVQVVEDNDEEIFFVDNWYWHRRGDHWFRTQRHDGGWIAVEPGVVPRTIVGMPVGRYRHWKHEVREVRREEKHERKEEKREKKGKH